LSDSGTDTRLPKLSYLVRDELLQGILGFFTERTGVRAWFQDASAYTVAPETDLPTFCSMLISHGRCGLSDPTIAMPADDDLPEMRMCMGGIGHLIIPITVPTASGETAEIGRLITEPLAIRETDFSETFDEAQRMHINPDNLSAAARQIKVVDRAELTQLTSVVTMVVLRVTHERTNRAQNLALAEAFEEVGLRGNRDVIDELLTSLVKEFTDADATVLTTSGPSGEVVHQPSFEPDIDAEHARLILDFTAEVTRWVGQTGYPISFPDLGGSAWCRHVLGGRNLEGSLVAVPIHLPGELKGWWTAYFREPMMQMEDQLHRLSVLSAHTAQTLVFMSRLEATQEQALTDALTGLHNRRYLLEQLERELARSVRGRYPVSLIIFDIDNFKDINDSYGHLAGDEALKHVAKALLEPLRRSSTICRFGGDEFCIVVPECAGDEARLVAERLKAQIEETPLVIEGAGTVQLRISGGVATQYPDPPPEADLFELADRELIRAKRQGKSQIVNM
jgi:diguanylate cyclase (GGDEF)-like protein